MFDGRPWALAASEGKRQGFLIAGFVMIFVPEGDLGFFLPTPIGLIALIVLARLRPSPAKWHTRR